MQRWMFITFLIFSCAVSALAEPYRRLVSFEWEVIEGASKYDVELKSTKKDGKTFKFQTTDAVWTGKLAIGNYEMKLRALDYRGVPGDWSAPSLFIVNLEPVQITSPALNANLQSPNDKETALNLAWKPVGGANNYKIQVESADGSFKKEFETDKTQLKVEVPAAQKFNWKVMAHGPGETTSDAPSESQFQVIGSALGAPVIEKPENEFVRNVKWSKPEHADKFDVTVSKLDAAKKQWVKVQEFKDVPDDNVPFDPKWEGGTYRVDLQAKGDMRKESKRTVTKFKVRKGDRSPAAEFNAEVRKSIDRINGWYGIASYLITQANHTSSLKDAPIPLAAGEKVGTVNYSAVGGTGRLGAGYFKDNQAWGFLGILDYSGFITKEGKNTTFASTEMSAVWRTEVGDRGEFRSQMGGFYKELPVVFGAGIPGQADTNHYEYSSAAYAGPHASAEYWYSMTPKLGFQMNTHFYFSMVGMKVPNGQGVVPTLSTQFGLLGSYRFSRRFTGLMGYARREDNFSYKSTVDGTNTVQHSGDYLNFFAEYSF